MKENKYDDTLFFEKYSKMQRSRLGLEGAGEWREFRSLLPDFRAKRVLDLGCGYGWHCIYAAESGAAEVTGVDISEKMLAVAREKSAGKNISYERLAMEEISYPSACFDIVLSSLAFHYIEDFDSLVKNVARMLTPGGEFVFSVEHPIYTAEGRQDWHYEGGKPAFWPVDRYFDEGKREALFLGEKVTKYHRSVTTYFGLLIKHGFNVESIVEPRPEHPEEMPDELRRPMMLIIRAVKKE